MQNVMDDIHFDFRQLNLLVSVKGFHFLCRQLMITARATLVISVCYNLLGYPLNGYIEPKAQADWRAMAVSEKGRIDVAGFKLYRKTT
jgi:hypothetical protein